MPEFSDFVTHPLGQELRKRVSKIIWKMAFFRYSKYALFSAQVQILEDLIELEDSLRSSRDQASYLRKRASELATTSAQSGMPLSAAIKQQIKALQDDASSYDEAVKVLRYGRWLYRYVADGIAWRAYGLNRSAIRALGAKEPVVFLSKKDGIEKEVEIFKAMRRLGREWLPIMHDLTNCLRTGDFSLFKNGTLHKIIELKIHRSGNQSKNGNENLKGSRETRQADRLKSVVEHLQTGDLELLDKNIKGKVFTADLVEKHHFKSISSVIKSSRLRKYSFIEPEYGLMYIAFDTNTRLIDDLLQNASKRHPHIFDSQFTFQGITSRFQEYHVSLPITAMQIPAKDMIDILFGRVAVMSIINFKCVEEYCHINDIPLHFERLGKEIKILVDAKPYPIEVREGIWNRLLYEGLTLQSFADLIKATIKESEKITD